MIPGEHKEFGLRSTAKQDKGHGRAGAKSVATVVRPLSILEILRSRLAKQIGGIALGIALVFAINAVQDKGWRMAGRALDAHWNENVGYPTVDRAFKRMMNPDASLSRAHAACDAQTAAVRLDRERTMALSALMDVYAGENLLVRFAAYLDCLSGEQPSRFCLASHKEHLRHALSDYFTLQRKVREEWALATAGPFGAERASLRDMPSKSDRPGFPSSRIDPRIIEGLRMLIEGGYLGRSDLGQRLSGDLSTALHNVERKRNACS